MAQENLHQARTARQDEFYTRIGDIQLELRNYKEYFRNKIVFCNCDDPYESNFFKYFALNFNAFGLKKIISVCYNGSPISGNELPLDFGIETKPAYKIVVTEIQDLNGDGAVDLADVELILKNKKNAYTKLLENGDFRSKESIELLKEADIVVTNPPFSLFREYVAQLEKYKKQFIIIGNTNALKYKVTFKMFQEDRIRTGYTNFNTGMYFVVPDSFEHYHHFEDGKKIARVSTACWYTNLPVKKHKEDLILYKSYNPEYYPEYDNYKAININTYADIPYDYNGVMGVPITFLDKYNPNQFEIIWTTDRGGDGYLENYKKPHNRYDAPVLNGKGLYTRILIRRRQKQYFQQEEPMKIAAEEQADYNKNK